MKDNLLTSAFQYKKYLLGRKDTILIPLSFSRFIQGFVFSH